MFPVCIIFYIHTFTHEHTHAYTYTQIHTKFMSKAYLNLPNFFIRNTDKKTKTKNKTKLKL